MGREAPLRGTVRARKSDMPQEQQKGGVTELVHVMCGCCVHE